MRLVVTALVFLIGLFFVLLGLGFLFQPVSTGAAIGISAINGQGLASLRGDVFAFFAIVGVCMVWGAWKRKGDLLLVPAIMMGLVIIGRLVSLATDGPYEGFAVPILLEVVIAAVALWARAMLPHHKLEDVGE